MTDKPSTTERLMNALITKMEGMDGDLQLLKSENKRLRVMYSNPELMLKKAGFIRTDTPLSQDLLDDPFRNDAADLLMKNEPFHSVPQSNEEFHAMSWDDIHEMADIAKTTELIP